MIKNVYGILVNGYQNQEEKLLTDNTLFETHVLFLISIPVPTNFVAHSGK